MNADELKELARMGKAALNASLFTVRPISNGFLMDYDDVEEYEIRVPVYKSGAPLGGGIGGTQVTETRHKWKIVRKEVFCADAEAIKFQVDDVLCLKDKIKKMRAQDVLSGEDELGTLGVVAAYAPALKGGF